jgi:hypothetical protein
MNVLHLAIQLKSDNTPWWAVVIVLSVFGLIAYGIFMTFIGSRETKIRGPALTGTARVISVKTRGAVGDPQQGAQRAIARIRLMVEVPGRAPYEATARQNFRPWVFDSIQAGRTVAVLVDSTNPQRVRLDLSQPVTQWQVRGPGAPQEVVAGLTDQIKEALENQFQQPITFGASGSTPTVAQQAEQYRQNPYPVLSAADLLATGQRVTGVLKSFAPTGTTPRSLGRTPSRPELVDAPHYVLAVDLQFPNMAPVAAQAVQPVPLANVAALAIGLQLACAVDPADPAHRFVVDWNSRP